MICCSERRSLTKVAPAPPAPPVPAPPVPQSFLSSLSDETTLLSKSTHNQSVRTG